MLFQQHLLYTLLFTYINMQVEFGKGQVKSQSYLPMKLHFRRLVLPCYNIHYMSKISSPLKMCQWQHFMSYFAWILFLLFIVLLATANILRGSMSIPLCLLYSLQAAFPYNPMAVCIAVFRCLPQGQWQNSLMQMKLFSHSSVNDVKRGSLIVSW